jgi:hypothetical protein
VNGNWDSAVIERRYRSGKASLKIEHEWRREDVNQPANAERRGRERLSRRAAEGAGKRRSDVGGDDDLFGRFLRLHLFAAARSDPGRRIQHSAVLDDFPDL